MPNAAITGWGIALPEKILSNADLARMVETSDEWIVSRTGIRERRQVGPTDTTLSLSVKASQRAIAVAGIQPEDLDLVIVATTTPDMFMPATASLLQARLGNTRAGAFDVMAACSGFVYALNVATQFVRAGTSRTVLVVGADTLTRMIDFTDRGTCVLFGDGAGAVVLQATDAPVGVLSTVLGSDGRGAGHLFVPGWGSGIIPTEGTDTLIRPYMKMNGAEVFRFSVRIMGEVAVQAVEQAGLSLGSIDLLIPHQANIRIIDAAARRLDLPRERVWANLDQYGNTSAGSVPICLAEAAECGVLRPGMNIVLVAFGAGLSWGASVVRWGRDGVSNPAQP
ncbi:MAG TPA: beta-ketoacyl-ACP synthase III [Thermomicrobiaceae bacterium]|nr:beta-ketoacyl-ACP synthase III [Thermomicrobiaceae bacterium]